MESGTARTRSEHYSKCPDSDDRIVEQRVAALLKINAEIAREKIVYRNDRERLDAFLMTYPIDSRKAFAYFGLMIGSLPPFALVLKIISETMPPSSIPIMFLVLLTAAGVMTGIAGYASARFIPSAIDRVSHFGLPNRIALLTLIGFGWGAVSGAVGGLFLFIVGAIFAGIVGGIIGAVTFPVLVVLFSSLRRGDFIEMKHFLPIAFGITLSLCAFILSS